MKDVELFENERAQRYDELIVKAIPSYEFIMSSMPLFLSKNVHNSNSPKLLVAGCGSGNEMKEFLQGDKSWQITGIDPSPDMIGIARKKLRSFGDFKLIVGQIKGLPESSKFDAATLSLVLHFLADNGAKQMLLKDISNRLKKGAPLIIVDMFGEREKIREQLDLLSTLLAPHFDSQFIKERSQRMLEEINYIPEIRFRELLKATGFSEPLRYHQSLMYGAWICHKL